MQIIQEGRFLSRRLRGLFQKHVEILKRVDVTMTLQITQSFCFLRIRPGVQMRIIDHILENLFVWTAIHWHHLFFLGLFQSAGLGSEFEKHSTLEEGIDSPSSSFKRLLFIFSEENFREQKFFQSGVVVGEEGVSLLSQIFLKIIQLPLHN